MSARTRKIASRAKNRLEGRKHRKPRQKTKKLKIPPALAEEAIEVLAEVAVGGKRRKTRRNK